MKITKILIVLLFAVLVLSSCLPAADNNTDKNNLEESCRANNGVWLEQYQECESISQQWCEQNNGQFNDCASACRHDAEADVCIEVCVPVCNF